MEVRLMRLPEVCERLRISRRTYYAHWSDVFTPRRCGRKVIVVLSDEVEVAVRAGREGVLAYRRQQGRLRDAA